MTIESVDALQMTGVIIIGIILGVTIAFHREIYYHLRKSNKKRKR